ncbi:hypothetical protein PO124_12125 [Bacillus licheniformis]|nr:hypothetical protein [Bacillus licheniformis]
MVHDILRRTLKCTALIRSISSKPELGHHITISFQFDYIWKLIPNGFFSETIV